MTFRTDIDQFTMRVNTREREVFTRVATEVQRSVVEGSPISAAPGQPVDTGYLKASFHGAFETPDVFTITTNVAYAPVIEEGVKTAFDPSGVERPTGLPGQGPGGKHIPSTVGGNHSVKLTLGAGQRIVDYATAEVANGR